MHKKLLGQFKSSGTSIGNIVELASIFLIDFGIKNAKNEVRWYLQKLYNLNSAQLYALKNKEIVEKLWQLITELHLPNDFYRKLIEE